MRVILRFILLIIFFLSATLVNIRPAEDKHVQNYGEINSSKISILDDSENYYLVASNNNYEISTARKEANTDLNDDRNKAAGFIKSWEMISYAESSHSDVGEKHKISSYLENIICIRAP